MSKASTRANVIQGVELKESFDDGAEQDVIGEVRHSGVSYLDDVESAGSVYNGTPSPGKKSRNKWVSGPPSEYLKESNFFSGVLLPSE
ncbi:hypothetical protein MKX01_021009, partial [Papaver californicum]